MLTVIYIIWIFINYIKEGSFIGMKGWAVNSIAIAVEGSIPFLPRAQA